MQEHAIMAQAVPIFAKSFGRATQTNKQNGSTSVCEAMSIHGRAKIVDWVPSGIGMNAGASTRGTCCTKMCKFEGRAPQTTTKLLDQEETLIGVAPGSCGFIGFPEVFLVLRPR